MRLVLKGSHEMLHAETQMSIPHKYEQACSAPDTVAAGAQASHKQTSIQSRPKISGVLHFATACTRRSSSALLHDALRSGTEKTMDSVARHVRSCSMVRHPSTGWNLMMAGADRLDGYTGTPAVSQRSESGEGILSVKEGRGMWLWSDVEVADLSSHMSGGG